MNFLGKQADKFLSIVLVAIAPLLKRYRLGGCAWPSTRAILDKTGLMVIANHYYDPKFIYEKRDKEKLIENRDLPINLNIEDQISFLSNLDKSDEILRKFSNNKDADKFDIKNGTYEYGDAEFLYQFIRHIKPKKIIEIGCGNSSKIIRDSLGVNLLEDVNYSCEYICIEPYKPDWFDFGHTNVIKSSVEECSLELFESLGDGDLLFIDSSHIIRPGGDVLYEYLNIIPNLKKGVYVHVHDIFTPNYYPIEWMSTRQILWNEQFLLESLLLNASKYKVIAALNFLKNNVFLELKKVAPFLEINHEPGAFYFQIKE